MLSMKLSLPYQRKYFAFTDTPFNFVVEYTSYFVLRTILDILRVFFQ